MPENVFLSYARQDGEAFAHKLHDRLEADGIMAWLDRRDIKPGEIWDLAIDNGIRECWAFLFLMTPGSVASENCHDEWSRALSFKKPVVPLLVLTATPPMRLHRLQYVDFREDFDKGLAQLEEHLSWMRTLGGELAVLRNRLEDLKREEERSERPDAVRAEIVQIEEQIDYKQRALDDPDEMRAKHRQVIEEGIDAERERFAMQRERDQAATSRRRVVGSAPQSVSDLFTDRAKELADVTNLLISERDDVRAVSVYGMGGIGKTALVCKAMQDIEKDHQHIQGLVYLSTRSTGISLERIYLGTAQLLGGEEGQTLNAAWTNPQMDTAAKIQTLIERYHNRCCVILLDNLEDLLDANGNLVDLDLRAFVDAFLRQRHKSRLLIASREPLNAANDARRYEKPYPLDLGLPCDFAIDLLKAFDHNGELGVSTAPESQLKTIAEKTQGYPRALEAVIGILAQDPLLSLSTLIQDENFFGEHVIEQLVKEAQSRLDADARRVMQALAVYGRPVTEAAVRFMLEPFSAGLDVGATLRRLARGRYVTVKRGTGELALHPLDKEYSYRQIPTDSSSGYNLKALQRQAANYYAQLRTPSESWKALQDLEPQLTEFDHLVKAEDYDAAARLMDEIDFDYLLPWGHAQRMLAMRLQLQGKITDKKLEATNLDGLGIACSTLGKIERAIEYTQQALAIVRELGDRRGEGVKLGNLAIAYRELGKTAQAIDHLQQALAIFREIGDQKMERAALGNLGTVHNELMQIEQAIDYFERALTLAQQIGNRRGEGIHLGSLSGAYLHLGQVEKAKDYAQQALAIVREIGDRSYEAVELDQLGAVYHYLNDLSHATESFDQALTIAREIGERQIEAYVLDDLGTLNVSLGKYPEAVNHLKEAIEIAAEIKEARLNSLTNTDLAKVYLYMGKVPEALATILAARKYDVAENNHNAALVHGLILARSNDDARPVFREAVKSADDLLAQTAGSFAAKYTKGLALCGIAVLPDTEASERSRLISEAENVYHAARTNCSAQGVIDEALHLLETLQPLDKESFLAPIQSILCGW